jgi:hypothetical protein
MTIGGLVHGEPDTGVQLAMYKMSMNTSAALTARAMLSTAS